MEINTSELVGPGLDWAVAQCQESDDCRNPIISRTLDGKEIYIKVTTFSGRETDYDPSTDWGQGGEIIDQEPLMQLWPWGGAAREEMQCACLPIKIEGGTSLTTYFGKTKLIAAMRCYVASKRGLVVDIPAELVPGKSPVAATETSTKRIKP